MPRKPNPPAAATGAVAVSAGNPCPFLRALVSDGRLADDVESLDTVARVVSESAAAGDGHPVLPAKVIYGIAWIAHGIDPLSLLRTRSQGLRLNALRNGPLDKKGVGSRILDATGKVVASELARLRGFAKDMSSADGSTEPGLGLAELRDFMDANFDRAAGRRRRIDRALMNGEWPVLLKVMGKDGAAGRYLSVRDVEALFRRRSLPARMRQRFAPP